MGKRGPWARFTEGTAHSGTYQQFERVGESTNHVSSGLINY